MPKRKSFGTLIIVKIGVKMYLKTRKVAIHIQSTESFVIFDYWVEQSGNDYVIRILKMEIVVSILRQIK